MIGFGDVETSWMTNPVRPSSNHGDHHVLSHDRSLGETESWQVTRVPTIWGRPGTQDRDPTVSWSVEVFGTPERKKWTAEGLANAKGPYKLPDNNGCFRPSGDDKEIYVEKCKEREEKRALENDTLARDEASILMRLQAKQADLSQIRRAKRQHAAEKKPLSDFMLPPTPSRVRW